jgi:signal transduction histidine kinase
MQFSSHMQDSQARIAELEAELKALRCEMQDFTCAMSHDLRAPLRHIVSFARLVEEDAGPQLSAEIRGFLATITGSAQQLGAMLDGLRELSRIGTQALAPQSVALSGLVAEVAAELALARAPRQLALEVDAPDSPVAADAAMLRVVVYALLDNAWKFTAPLPEAQARVRVRAWQPVPGTWSLEVEDNGVGFVAKDPALALRMFARLHAASAFPGLGIGLALAAKAAQRMGGVLQLAPAQPAGCLVTLSFPEAGLNAPRQS